MSTKALVTHISEKSAVIMKNQLSLTKIPTLMSLVRSTLIIFRLYLKYITLAIATQLKGFEQANVVILVISTRKIVC